MCFTPIPTRLGAHKGLIAELGVDEHAVIKTLIFEDEHRKPVVVLMHGDLEVFKALARFLGVTIAPAKPEVAEKHRVPCRRNIAFRLKSPYRFMWKRPFCVAQDLINAGSETLVEIEPACLENLLQVTA